MKVFEAMSRLAEVSSDQWGLLTTAQAGELGVNTTTLVRLVEAGLLMQVRHGVYAVSAGEVTAHQDEKAVWLKLNPGQPGWRRPKLDLDGGVVSHRSAALLHGLGDLVAPRIEMTVPRRRRVRDASVRLRRAELSEDDVTLVDGLPVTTVLRTIVDLLADHVDASHLAQVIQEADRAGKVDLDELADRAAPYARRYGIAGRDGRALLEHLRNHIDAVRATGLDKVRSLLAEQQRIAEALTEAMLNLDTSVHSK